MMVCMIAAVADNGAIGVHGAMPWHIGEDLKYFKRVTMGCPVIMGRATYESLGRPLPGRKNIVMSRSRTGFPEGVVCVNSADEALLEAERTAAEKCFVIGGGKVYSELLNRADKLYLTRVHVDVEDADTFFPSVDSALWMEESRSETMIDGKSGISFEFIVYCRAR